MGNTGSSIARVARPAARRKLPEAPKGVDEAVLMRKIEQDEAQRSREMVNDEELGRKDAPLDGLLSQLQGAIRPKTIKVTGNEADLTVSSSGNSPSGSQGVRARTMSAADFSQPIPLYTPSTQHQGQPAQGGLPGAPKRAQGSPWLAAQNDEQGRAQAFALREVLEAKNLVEHLCSQAARAERERWSIRSDAEAVPGVRDKEASASNQGELNSKELDISELAQRHGMDLAKLELLLKYTSIPVIGRFKTFGHEYMFARPPPWWLHGADIQSRPQYQPMFKSEPTKN